MVSRSSLQSRVRLLCRNYAGYYLFRILLTDDARSNAGFDAGFVPSLMPDIFPLYAGMMTPNMTPDSMPDMFPLYARILPHINLLPDIIN